MSERQAWLAVVQEEDGDEETELVTIEAGNAGMLDEGTVVELTNGQRITFTTAADELTDSDVAP